MLKKYFEDESYNIMPCGVVAFQNDSTLKIISANDYYYSTYANGNFESLNICEEDKNIIADLKDKNEVVYKCIVSDGTIRYICMHLTKYNENDILGILMDVTEQHTNLVRMKDERRCFTFALKSSKNIVFEHNVADDNMTLYIPVKGQTELKKLSIPNNTEDAVYELADKRDYGYLKENIYNEKVENISVRMTLPGNKNYEWHRIFRNFEHDEKGNLKRIFGTITNIEDEKHHEKELKEKIEIDPVLHVYNRNAGVERINEYIKSNPESRDYALFVIDIDDFRKVNDGLGIVAGDELVQQFGSFLKEFNGDDVIVCHLTSDVYCMAIYDPCGNKSVEHIHKKIVKRTREPFYLVGGQVLNITVSVGVAEYPEAATSALELINCAEIVMFKGKAMGKNRIQYFDTPILNDFLKNVELDSKLKEAVFENNFLLYYQPQYYAGNRKLRGVEALIRWKDGNGRMISPAKFIPIAEKNGTIIPIGNWVLEQSIRTFSEWRNRYGVPFVLSVNISALQYQKEDFVETLLNIIHKYDVDPDEIELEITESILIDDFSAVTEKMQLLKEYGIRISLDDFGTGFSSLSYLKKLPINTLKIDKSFTDTLLTDSATRIITESIVSMVKSLGFESIAEGVEEEQQYKYLRAVGCDIIQGYLFGKPLSQEEIEQLLQKMY